MRVHGYCKTWDVEDEAILAQVLAWRDDRGGAMFILAQEDEMYPALGIRVTGNLADVFYSPGDGHPGFWCMGGHGLPEGGFTTLVYEGCDPASGEEVPNEFIVSVKTALSVAKEFLRSKQMSAAESWFEL